MSENRKTVLHPSADPMLADLARALDVVGDLVAGVRPDQWSAPTPCTDWKVRRLVEHLIGMNRVFAALLAGTPAPPRPTGEAVVDDPVAAFRESADALLSAFAQPGALERTYSSPMGSATGAERLHIRMYDLLAHGWDLAQAADQPVRLPEDLAEQSLRFVQTQLTDEARTGRFAAAQAVQTNAPAVERLVAFLGRAVTPPP